MIRQADGRAHLFDAGFYAPNYRARRRRRDAWSRRRRRDQKRREQLNRRKTAAARTSPAMNFPRLESDPRRLHSGRYIAAVLLYSRSPLQPRMESRIFRSRQLTATTQRHRERLHLLKSFLKSILVPGVIFLYTIWS